MDQIVYVTDRRDGGTVVHPPKASIFKDTAHGRRHGTIFGSPHQTWSQYDRAEIGRVGRND